GHRLAVLGRVDVAAVFGTGGFEGPAEHGAVEVCGPVDIRRRQVDPAGGTLGCAFTDGHNGLLLEVAGSLTDIDRRRLTTHRLPWRADGESCYRRLIYTFLRLLALRK